MNKSRARLIAFLGVMFALIFVFLLVETFALSAIFGNFTPAALSLPLVITLTLVGLKKPMFVGGTLLGLASFTLAICISNPIFLNPLISILPRIFIGVVAFPIYKLFLRIFENSKSSFLKDILPFSIAGGFGTLANSVFTVFMMWVFNSAELASVFTVILSINFVAEVIAAVLLVPVYGRVISKIRKRADF